MYNKNSSLDPGLYGSDYARVKSISGYKIVWPGYIRVSPFSLQIGSNIFSKPDPTWPVRSTKYVVKKEKYEIKLFNMY